MVVDMVLMDNKDPEILHMFQLLLKKHQMLKKLVVLNIQLGI